MGAALTLDTKGLRRLANKLNSPAMRKKLEAIPQKKAVAALVAQAIADNFDQEGPGWAPLKASSIRSSLAKSMRKRLSKMSDAELLRYEKGARLVGSKDEPNRRILQKTGLLRNTVTKPGFSGSNKSGQSGRNIIKTEGTKLIYGTDLVYAGVHQNGSAKRGIPARPFMTLRAEWKKQLVDYVVEQAFEIIWMGLKGAGAGGG